MNTFTYEKPLEWYIAKLDYLYENVEELPVIHLGKRCGADVLRIYSGKDGYKQIGHKSKRWEENYSLCCKRNHLVNQIEQLNNELVSIYHTTYGIERPKFKILKNTTSGINMKFYNSLINDACTYAKTHVYEFDGHNFRSRFELSIAEVIKDLQIDYKYDSGIQLPNKTVFPDFAFGFPEFNRCIILEALGRLDDHKYTNDNIEKIRDYCNGGFILDEDLFTLGSSEKAMPNKTKIRHKIISIIGTLCSTYVIPI